MRGMLHAITYLERDGATEDTRLVGGDMACRSTFLAR